METMVATIKEDTRRTQDHNPLAMVAVEATTKEETEEEIAEETTEEVTTEVGTTDRVPMPQADGIQSPRIGEQRTQEAVIGIILRLTATLLLMTGEVGTLVETMMMTRPSMVSQAATAASHHSATPPPLQQCPLQIPTMTPNRNLVQELPSNNLTLMQQSM